MVVTGFFRYIDLVARRKSANIVSMACLCLTNLFIDCCAFIFEKNICVYKFSCFLFQCVLYVSGRKNNEAIDVPKGTGHNI